MYGPSNDEIIWWCSSWSMWICFHLELPPPQNDCLISRIFFVPNWLFGSALLEIWGSKSHIFVPNSLHQEAFRHHDFWGRSGVVALFYFKSHIYNYLVNGQRALILPKIRNVDNHFGTQEVLGKWVCSTWCNWCNGDFTSVESSGFLCYSVDF